jgi:uncharacterized protein YbaR (Trm112 family)
MNPSLLKKLCCPFDKLDLDVKVFVRDKDENIIEGLLSCAHCKRFYPIVYGVPIMSPDEYREPQLETPLLQRWEKDLKGNYVEGFRLLTKATQ